MSLSEIGEFGFIDRIAPGCLVDGGRVVAGIGDDCSVVRGAGGRVSLVTTDLLIEGVHFLRRAITPRQLGAKAMAVNLSDVAAMGGEARDAYVSLAIPPDVALDFLDELYGGLKQLATQHRVNILGGDTTASGRDLVLSVTVTGEMAEGQVLLRSGARPGDRLFVTGELGDAGAGLHAILNGHAATDDTARELARRHHEPRPHLEAGRRIAATGLAHAMIDVSDGLAADLGHVCDQSRVGCQIEAARLPLSAELRRYCAAHSLDPIRQALAGGEDYVLLLAADAALAAHAEVRGRVALHDVGEIIAGPARTLVTAEGGTAEVGRGGWDHLRAR